MFQQNIGSDWHLVGWLRLEEVEGVIAATDRQSLVYTSLVFVLLRPSFDLGGGLNLGLQDSSK